MSGTVNFIKFNKLNETVIKYVNELVFQLVFLAQIPLDILM